MKKLANFTKICQNLLEDLSSRQKEVIIRRFGLKSGQGETLESIGRSYQITRERVRQIETDALLKIKPKIKDYQKVFEGLANYLESWGNLKREDILLFQLGRRKSQSHLYFLLTLHDQFSRFTETKDFYTLWTIDPHSLNLTQKINNLLISQLRKKGEPLSFSEIFEIYQKSSLSQKVDSQALLSFIEISKGIEKGIDNLFGLRDWPAISPRGIKDKAYLVLKKTGKPLHFTEVSSLISKLDFSSQEQKTREVFPQTVHNELIRDSRFVLVGRGIYALREQGYIPGFVKEIIEEVLREKGRPMTKEEIIEEVLKQRLVKANTILLNLQNKKYFLKNSQEKYTIKEI